jgi:predicted HNH restriction endonuclease
MVRVYGSIAQGFIHVHHLRPVSEITGAYEVDPVADLRPVCPNCHAIVHIGGETRTIEEVRELIEEQNIHREQHDIGRRQ